ncbi:ribonuclease VapC1 [bacterium BMS3Bbin04]|nr:ribonuclease VapC1 [bacterium BMS3Bbin04]
MSYLVLDTNIVSYIMKGDPLAEPYKQHLLGKTLAISFMTVAELYEGAYRKGWGQKKMARLCQELQKYLVIPYSPSICEVWGRLRAERKHQPISVDDGWVAATALVHGCPVVTHNEKDFHNITGLVVIAEPSVIP